ncbi:aminopeptidase P N-terminal domain-containing protein [Porifericola rhodea]|uniref:aminopeptidase P N-terminal domain-containing protein n=1 Tax=Porifericola rhodea TaxID=930972 RepID=UPI00266635DB|nr:aminopeptidase P N-terminal domain-containing protein [Porifericola rhodea]WKN29575.1 aminopeptidase P N-terminal domain-containing protein [Porifericola rhodea]
MKRYRLLVLFFLIANAISGWAQTEKPDDFLPMDFHQDRREALRAKMPPNSVAVFFANPVRNRSNDVDYHYHQDPNFYYLTGHTEPHAVLLIFKEKQQVNAESFDEIIFVRGHDALKELYDGGRLGKEGARKTLKIDVTFEGSDFKEYNIDFSKFDKVLFYDFHNDVRDTKEDGDLYDLIATFKQKINYPDEKEMTIEVEPAENKLDTKSLDKMMKSLRGIKTEEELELLRKAVKISALGQAEVMKAMHPGMSELEVQGMHEFIYKKYQAEHEGYPSIVGAGHNGCVLHYIENYKPKIEDGELILMDLGAEYHGYTADVTRTLPVNGKFTKEQKIIYDLVYEAQEAAMAICKEGTTFKELYAATARVINQGLVELGIYKSLQKEDIINPATGRNRYYPHGCTHHIGLDVHDLGENDTLRAGMVITIEPGIYIPEGSPCDPKWWNIPVRIEDDFLITEEGYELLSDLAPRRSEEVEALMAQPSSFENITLPSLEE